MGKFAHLVTVRRRIRLGGIGTGVLVLTACGPVRSATSVPSPRPPVLSRSVRQPAPPPATWEQYGANPATHNPVWSGPTGAGWTSSILPGAPTYQVSYGAATGDIYVGFMTAHRGGVAALRLRTGALVWLRWLPNQVMDTPIIVDGRVVVGFGNNAWHSLTTRAIITATAVRGTGPSGVAALDATTGRVDWIARTHREVMPTVAVWHDEVMAATGGRHWDVWNAQTGQLLWQQWLGGLDSMAGPAVVGDTAYVPTTDPATVVAVDLRSHALRWLAHRDQWVSGWSDTNPLVANGMVWVAGTELPLTATDLRGPRQAAIAAIAATTGRVMMDRVLGVGPRPPLLESGQITAADGLLFYASPVTQRLYALRPSTAQVVWQRPLIGAKGGVAVWGQTVLALDGTALDLLDAATGRRVGRISLAPGANAGASMAAPIVIGNRVVVPVPLDRCPLGQQQCGRVEAIPLRGEREGTA